MKKMIAGIIVAMAMSGCSAVTATVKFKKVLPGTFGDGYVTGEAKVRADRVQEFRSFLESLEYRETEKVK